jgi:predicted RND superfamily exporter protein
MTTLTTLLTFGTLTLTSTPAIRSLGVILGVGMTASLAGTLFLLAPILRVRRSAADASTEGVGQDTG